MKNVINYSNNGILPFPGKKTGWGAAIFFFTLFWMFWVRTDPVNTLTVSLDQKAKNYRKNWHSVITWKKRDGASP